MDAGVYRQGVGGRAGAAPSAALGLSLAGRRSMRAAGGAQPQFFGKHGGRVGLQVTCPGGRGGGLS